MKAPSVLVSVIEYVSSDTRHVLGTLATNGEVVPDADKVIKDVEMAPLQSYCTPALTCVPAAGAST